MNFRSSLILVIACFCATSVAQSCTATTVPDYRIGCQTSTRLSAVAPEPSERGRWSIGRGMPLTTDQPANSNVTIHDEFDPNTLVTNITQTGIYVFTWTISQGGCPDKTDTLVIRKIVDADILNGLSAGGGANKEQDDWCSSTFTLNGNVPGAVAMAAEGRSPDTGIKGTWSTDTGAIAFTNASLFNSQATNIPEGTQNILRWTVGYPPSCNSAVDHVHVARIGTVTPSAPGATINNGCLDTFTLAATAVNAPETGKWSVKSGSATFTDDTLSTTAGTNLGIGTNVLTWTVTNGTCTSSNDVIVNRPAVPTSNAGADQSLCYIPVSDATPLGTAPFATTALLAGNQPTPLQLGTWTQTAGAGANWAGPGQSANLYNTRVTLAAQVQMNTFTWTVSAAGLNACADAVDTVNVDVTARFTLPVASASSPLGVVKDCGVTTHTMDATAPAAAGETGVWSVVTGPGFTGSGTFDDVNNAAAVVTGLTAGVNKFRYTHAIDGCPTGPGTDFTVTVPPQPTANGGPNQLQICGSTATMAAAVPAPGLTGKWLLVSEPVGVNVVITTPTSPVTTVTGLPTDGKPVYLVWEVDGAGGACVAINSTQVILVAPTGAVTTADAGPSHLINCDEDTIKMDANLPVSDQEEGLWTVTQGAGTFLYPELRDTPVSGVGVGVNVYTWTITRNNCISGARTSSSTVTITRPAQPTANAGVDQVNLCAGVVSLNANPPSAGQTGYWTARPHEASVTFADPTAYNTTATFVSHVGEINTFTWTVRAGANCRSRTDVINVIRPLTLPTAAITAPALTQVAGGTPYFNAGCQAVSVTGTAPGNGNQGRWTSSLPGITFGDNTMSTTTLTISDAERTAVPTFGLGTQFPGHLITWTISRPGDCDPASNSVASFVLILGEAPQSGTTDAGNDVDPWCLATLPAGTATTPGLRALAGKVPANGVSQIGAWSGPGVITSPNSLATTVTGLTASATPHTFTWTRSLTGDATNCPPAMDTMTVNVPKILTAAAGADQCMNCGVFSTTLAATPVLANEAGKWTVVLGAGIFADDTQPNTVVSALQPGVNRFAWTVTDATTCLNGGAATDTVDIILPVLAAAGPDIDLGCGTSTGVFAANPATACQSGIWTQINQGVMDATVAVNASTSPTSGFVAPQGQFTMRWTLTNQNAPACPTFFDDVIIERLSITTAIAGPDQDVGCDSTATLAANAVAPGETGIWSVSPFGGVTFADPSNPTTTVSNIKSGLNRLTWTIHKPRECICSQQCAPSQDTLTLTRVVTVTPADAGVNQYTCDAKSVVVGNTAVLGTGAWTTASGTGTVDNPTAPVSAVSGLTAGAATVFTWTISASGCTTPSSSSVTFNRYQIVDAGPPQTVGVASATLTGTGNSSDVLWTVVSGAGNFADPTSLVTEVTGLGAGANEFRLTFGPCPDYSDTVVITNNGIGAPPTVASAPTTAAPTLPAVPCMGGNLTGDSCNCQAGSNCVCGQGLATSVCNCGFAATCSCLAPLAVCNGQNATSVTVGAGVTTVNCGGAGTCTQLTDAPTVVPPASAGASLAASLFFAALVTIALLH